MTRNIINAPDLRAAVADALRGHAALAAGAPALPGVLKRATARSGLVRRARRRGADPAWAQAAFDRGDPLWRLDDRPAGPERLRRELDSLLERLETVAKEAAAGDRDAAAFLRGLAHRRDADLGDLWIAADAHLACAADRRLLARRDEALRAPLSVGTGSLVATRCASVGAAMALGREARNCLAGLRHEHHAMVAGTLDVWALRDGGRLLAVLAERDGRVQEVQGPRNAALPLADAMAVARLCGAAGLALPRQGAVLAEFAEPPRLGPVAVTVGRVVTVYAEWMTAVRIDRPGSTVEQRLGRRLCSLGLAFDPARPLAEAMVADEGLRDAVQAFGRRRLRRVVAAVARGEAGASLVQHRLLALAG